MWEKSLVFLTEEFQIISVAISPFRSWSLFLSPFKCGLNSDIEYGKEK